MLFESIRNCHIWIPLEILSFVDLKISKIEPEMAELALFVFYPRSRTWPWNSYRKVIDLEREPLPWDANPFHNWFLWRGGKTSFPQSTERKWPLGTNYQPDRNMELQSKSVLVMLLESMRKCCIRIPLEILLILDQKILKIELEMAKLALYLRRHITFLPTR